MGYSITVPPRGENDSTPPASAYDLGQKIRAALACGFFVWLLLFVGASALCLPAGRWQKWLWGLAVSVVVGLLVTGGLGFWWAWLAAYHALGVDRGEIRRRHRREDAAEKRLVAAVAAAKNQVQHGDDHDSDPATFTTEQRLDWVTLDILDRAYRTGQPTTREAMTGEGRCTQAEWNLINKSMKALGLKKGYTMQPADFGMAWALWREGIKVEADEEGEIWLWYLKQNGRWHALESLVSG